MKKIKPLLKIFASASLLLSVALNGWAADDSASLKRVAILPFSMHTPSDLAYLQNGIRDMLASRLAWQNRVQVIDRTATEQALRGQKSDITLNDALRIGSTLKADYVLFGSVTALGQAISIDAKVAPVTGAQEPFSLYAQTRTLDEVIPQVNRFAQDINQKIFARPVEQAQAPAVDNETLSTRNPELLVPDTMMSGDRLSSVNPNFIEVTPEGSTRQSGLWRSQTFQGGIMGIDVGDPDGDGRVEIVAVTKDKVTVYRREAQGLKTLAVYNGDNVDRFLAVSMVDVNRDGRDEIYVTNLRKRNSPKPSVTESVRGDSGFTEDLSSFGLTLSGGKLQRTSGPTGYFLNGVDFPHRGKVLLGQQKGLNTQGAFNPNIYEMQVRGKDIVTGAPVPLPQRCNVFNFAKADINGDHAEEFVVIDKSNALLILSQSGEQLWKNDRLFAATTNSFEGKVEDRRYNAVELYSIPSSIVVTDLNRDNTPEIVVTRSSEAFGKFMPNTMQNYDKTEIVSLSWDQLGLVENWRSREVGGMVTGLRVGDLNHDSQTELVASMVLAKDFLRLGESKSTIFSYDLNASDSKDAAQTP